MTCLGTALSNALLMHPELLDDFPNMIGAFDAGEFVNVDAVNNISLRFHLNAIMTCLPLQHSSNGWYKQQSIMSIGGILLMSLVQTGHIKQPARLTQPEIISSQFAPIHLLKMLANYGDSSTSSSLSILNELRGILENILCGEVVQLSGVEDKKLANIIKSILFSLGAVEENDNNNNNNNDGDDFDEIINLCMPNKVKQYNSYENTRKGMNIFLNLLKSFVSSSSVKATSSSPSPSPLPLNVNNNLKEKNHVNVNVDKKLKLEKRRDDHRNENVNKNRDGIEIVKKRKRENENEQEQEIERPLRNPGSGPTLLGRGEYNPSDSESDDEFGPQLKLQGKGLSQEKQILSIKENNLLDEFQRNGGALSTAFKTDNDNINANEVGREEWMMSVGDGKALNMLEGTFGKERKFAAGKQANQAAASLQARKAAAARAIPIDTEIDKAMEAHKQARGPSLMDAHHEARLKAHHDKKHGTSASASASNSFNYSRDIQSYRKKIDDTVKEKIIQDAMRIDERFDKSIQR